LGQLKTVRVSERVSALLRRCVVNTDIWGHFATKTKEIKRILKVNKNPISLYSMSDFKYLTAYNGRYDTNTTVMWWAGVLNFVDERVDKIVDKVIKTSVLANRSTSIVDISKSD
jgi:hypothetical protein